MYVKNAELKAGIVVLAAIAALLALLFFATGADLFTPKRRVHIRFAQGFAAPKEGDPVLLNGLEIGRIEEVQQREERRSGSRLTAEDRAALGILPGQDGELRELYVLAIAKLARSQVIPKGTTAEIGESITGTRKLSLLPGPFPENLTDEDTHLQPIPGRQAGDLGDIMRSVQALVRKVTELVENGQTVVGDVRALLRALQQKVEAIEAAEISANVRDATASLKATLAAMQGRLDEISQNVGSAAVDLKETAAEGKGIAQRAAKDVNELLASLNRIAAQIDQLVQRTAPEIEAIVADVRVAAANLKSLSGDFGGLGAQLEGIVGDAGGDIRRTFARLAEVGRNLQDASEDIKAHPWKLLNKPDAQEIAYENLRTATQNYVRAAALMNETQQRIQELLQRKDLPEAALKQALDALVATLKRQMADFDRVAEFLERLLRQGGGPPGVPLR